MEYIEKEKDDSDKWLLIKLIKIYNEVGIMPSKEELMGYIP